MILDAAYKFADGQALSGTSDQVSTNVYDAGSAKKLFAGGGEPFKIPITLTAVGGTSPTFRARFVGADDAALTTNPEILADTGATGTLAAADLPLRYELVPAAQRAAKRYYGVIFLQGGTTPTGTVYANGAMDAQSRLLK